VKRSQLGMLLSMFAVFASGICVGAFGYHSYTVKTVAATTGTQPPKRTPEEWRKIYVEELRSRLQLDGKQITDLNTILDDTRSQFHALKNRQKQEADQLREQIRSDQTNKVRAMLKPEQRDEYEKFRDERDRKMKADMAAREQAEKAAKAQAGKAGN
jgi:hypothetical protein